MARELPDSRRRNWTQKAKIADDQQSTHSFFLTVGLYEDGRPCEIFLTASKAGTFIRGVLDTLARSVSLSLQSGASVADVVKMLEGMHFPPAGRVIADCTQVTLCTSVADYIAQELRNEFLRPTTPLEKIAGNYSAGAGY